MMTGSVSAGSGDTGAIVWTPAPRILNEIVSVNPECELALVIAWRNDPGPLSLVLVTIRLNGTCVGVDGNVSTGGVFEPVFDDSDTTVVVTRVVTAGQLGDNMGQNGWMPSFGGAPGPLSTSLSHARSVTLMCSPGCTSTVVLVGAGSRGFGGAPGWRSAAVRLTLKKIWFCPASLISHPTAVGVL